MRKFFRKKFFNLSFVLIAVVILLIFLHYVKALTPLESLLTKALSPVQAKVYLLGNKINNFLTEKAEEKDLQETNRLLKQQINDLLIENAQLKEKASENEILRQQLNFLKGFEVDYVSAEVIGREVEKNFHLLILNIGLEQKVKVGYPVIVGEGILVGKVVETGRNISKVILTTDNRSEVAATIQAQDRTMGIVTGEHGISLRMDLIPKDIKIQTGEIVITSGMEKTIPRGLVIGQVDRVRKGTNDFFQTAHLKTLVPVDNLTTVSVLIFP